MKKSTNYFDFVSLVNDFIEKGRREHILQLYTEDEFLDGRFIHIDGKQLINFGSCSYLGLEIDDRLKAAAIEAIQRYGIQYSSSRSYVSSPLYKELEELVGKIFEAPVLLTPTITLGHQAVIPIAVESGDAIILDQQVHASVQYPAKNMQLQGVSVSMIRHNNMEELELAIINKLPHARRIWYMADGIYSMYGDFAPLKRLELLLAKYPKLHLYIDDAHGMSWTGKSGRGFVLSQMNLHPRMIVGTSFAKGFGSGGGAFVFPDASLCQKVRNCGGPLIFSGPNQIPVIAASIASAKIHLSDEITVRQDELKRKLLYCHQLMMDNQLPVISNPETPIKFVGLGLPRVGYNLVKKMMSSGFYCNLAIFPAVPETCTGLRFTITWHHTNEDIVRLISALAYHLPAALAEEDRTMNDIYRAFRKSIVIPKEPGAEKVMATYRLQHETTIKAIPESLWNRYLGKNSCFDWSWINFLEATFKNNELLENNWDFHYYIIWDCDNNPVCLTFFTIIINKDDIFSPDYVSHQLEQTRKSDPYYLCSKTMMMGTILSEGEHLYIDRSASNWKDILMLLLDAAWKEQELNKAGSFCLRDFHAEDVELQDFFQAQGFLKIRLPDTHVIDDINWSSAGSFLKRFNSRARWYLKDNVLKYQQGYTTEIVAQPTKDDIDHWYELYKNVKEKSFDLNTFDLPKKIFENMVRSTCCEILQLRLDVENGQSKVVAVTFNFLTASNNYCGLIIGLDYNYLKSHAVYKQTLFTSVLRAGEIKADKMFLGFTASEVKKKFGARAVPQVAYVQMQDHFSLSVISSIPNTNRK